MTITTADSRPRSARRASGFTLTEMLVSMSIASMVLGAVFSALLFISRSCVAAADYSDMDREARAGLEVFAREARMASGVSDFSANGVRLQVPTATGSYLVDYTYVPEDGAFYRAYGTSEQRTLITGIDGFVLRRFKLQQSAATNDLETKQLQLELRAVRFGPARPFASNNVISARYVLRNKIVSN